MIRTIEVLETLPAPEGSSQFRYVFRVPTPDGIAVDGLEASLSPNANADELAALQAGTIVEYQDAAFFSPHQVENEDGSFGWGEPWTPAEIRIALEGAYESVKDRIQSDLTARQQIVEALNGNG